MSAIVQQLPAFGWWCANCNVGAERYASRERAEADAAEHNAEFHGRVVAR